MTNNRKRALRLLNLTCMAEFGLELSDLPDLPCVANALDEMEQLMDDEGDNVKLSDLQDIAQEAVYELAEEEGMYV